MGRWLGGVYGNTKLATESITDATGVYTISDQYYMKQEGGWNIPPGTQSNPITTGPAQAYIDGNLSDGNTYWWANVGNATVNAPKQYQFVRHDGKSWVKITDADFSGGTAGTGQPNFNYTGQGVAGSPTGWKQHNGDWYWCCIPTSRDNEGWNDWNLGSIPFRYWRCTMYWAPLSSGSNINSGHPDNDNHDSFKTNDTNFNNRYTPGSGNKSYHRFGIANVQHQAQDELGFAGERSSIMTNIYTGNKTGNYASGVSLIGSGAGGYWDLGSTSGSRTFRFTSGDESGAGGSEQHAWCPHEMWLSDG